MPRNLAREAYRADLWRRFKKEGDLRARTRLIEEYDYLVRSTRSRIVPSLPVKILPEDLDACGLLALVKAVDQFNPRRRVQFESYAIAMVRGAMLEHLRHEDWVPRSVRAKEKRIRQAAEAVSRRGGPQAVTDSTLATELDLPLDAFYQLYFEATVLNVVSLDDAVGDSEHDTLDPLLVLDQLKSWEPDPDQVAFADSQRALLQQCITWLPANERTVVRFYYYEGLTLKQTARRIQKSESRAHQLHSQAIQRLSGFLARQRGLFFPEVLPQALEAHQ